MPDPTRPPGNGIHLRKSTAEDHREGLSQVGSVDNQYDKAACHIEKCHKWNQFFTYLCNGLHAAEDDKACDSSGDDTHCEADKPWISSDQACHALGAGNKSWLYIAVDNTGKWR